MMLLQFPKRINPNSLFKTVLGARSLKFVSTVPTTSSPAVILPPANPLFAKYRAIGNDRKPPTKPKSLACASKFKICEQYFARHNSYFADPNDVHRRNFNRLIQSWIEQYGRLKFNDRKALDLIVSERNRVRGEKVSPLQVIAVKLCQEHFDSISKLKLSGFNQQHLRFLKKFSKWSQVPHNNIAIGLRLINNFAPQ